MSLEWNAEQTRILIDERKMGNEEYHQTPKRCKKIFWEEIAEKLNENYNTNYFTGEACNKKFLSLTRAYYTTKARYEGTKNKRSLVREQYYEEFSTEFWKEPLRTNEGTGSLGSKPSSSNSPRRSQPPSKIPRPLSSSATVSRTGTASKNPRAIPSPNKSHPTTPSISRPPSSSSRPVTSSFSQSAETINIYINYNKPDDQE
ncbi:hypothetical protein RhiirA5_477251 [Rhizophagus irregularis]|uniref:Myb/SANT-like DNA-binding domain-containing protein n=1 Tax=Rhizophagus irregularis TaxID=588596 RepID=A0A2N0NJX0_9GLOM|nr:hypothetical protein RhiirA5_477251 [Rhizophagus irregularis]CAB5166623.1 unnamed protein product [Rhizophagus irregularis]